MATRRKPKPKKLKFELTKSAIGGIGVVVFCLFLWMFLLGVWAGQSVLVSGRAEVENRVDVQELNEPKIIRAEKKIKK